MENLGSQSADDVYILVGFDAGGGKLWNPEESKTLDLPIDQSITITVTLRVPLEKHTRLMVQIVDDGNAVDESYSEWFDTRYGPASYTRHKGAEIGSVRSENGLASKYPAISHLPPVKLTNRCSRV